MDKEIINNDDKKVVVEKDKSVSTHKNPWVIPAVILGAFFLLWLGALASFGFLREHRGVLEKGFVASRVDSPVRGGHMMGGFGVREGMMDDNQSRLTGVVTKVDGKSFTIAGNGSTNSVTVNDSTQYTNGSTVAVNDTVMVVGTVNNGTFTATRVVVNPGKGL